MCIQAITAEVSEAHIYFHRYKHTVRTDTVWSMVVIPYQSCPSDRNNYQNLIEVLGWNLNQGTTIPLHSPLTRKEARKLDPDFFQLRCALQGEEKPARDRYKDPGLHNTLTGLIVKEYGTIFKMIISKSLRIQKLQKRVMNNFLRNIFMSVWHYSPLSRNMRIDKTLWLVASPFWRTLISQKVCNWVHSYMHFQLLNSTYLSSSSPMHILYQENLWDAIFLWISDPWGRYLQSGEINVYFWCIKYHRVSRWCDHQKEKNSERVARTTLHHLFMKNSRLVIVDNRSA